MTDQQMWLMYIYACPIPHHWLLSQILLAWTNKKIQKLYFVAFNEWNRFLSLINFGQHVKLLQTVAEKSQNAKYFLFRDKLGLSFHRHKQIPSLKTISRFILLSTEALASYCKCYLSTIHSWSCELQIH